VKWGKGGGMVPSCRAGGSLAETLFNKTDIKAQKRQEFILNVTIKEMFLRKEQGGRHKK